MGRTSHGRWLRVLREVRYIFITHHNPSNQSPISSYHTKTTVWRHPRTNKLKRVSGDLPRGWERRTEDGTGKTLFVDLQNNTETYTDPRLAFAIEETPQNMAEVRQRFDASSTALQVLHGKDLHGKRALITGCNTGIGLETAKSLAHHGCEVIMANRNKQATREVIAAFEEKDPNAKNLLRFVQVDLSSMKSVRDFVHQIKLTVDHLDFVILNAAVFALPHTVTEDGLETLFQVCHLSHFYIVTRLEGHFDHRTRIIVLSSESHRMSNLPDVNLQEDHLSVPASKYMAMLVYNNVKLCNVLFARELGRKWQSKGISVFSCHPGNMVSSSLSRNWWFYRLLFAVVRPFTKSLQQAAATTIYCATAEELTGLTGLYFNNCYICETSKKGQSDYMGERLWAISEEIIKRIEQRKE